MAGGLFPRLKRWIQREDLRTDDLNAEFDNIITNFKPDKMDDYSQTVSQMRETFDPGNVGTENQPQSTADELKALRYQLDLVIGKTYWYEPPTISLEEVSDAISGGFGIANNRIVSGRVDANGQPMFLVPNGAALTAVLEAAPTNLTTYINGSIVTFLADQTITGLQAAPSVNNTCLVNDAALVGQQSTKTQGERGTVVTIDTIGANITALNGQYAAFLKGSEIFLAEVDTTNNQLKNCFRGFAFDSTDAWLARQTLSNNDSITLLKLAWVFATNNSGVPGYDITYNKPIASGTQPTSPSIGDYWFDIGASTWKKYNGSTFPAQEALFVGATIQSSSACVGARSFDFFKTLSELNSVEMEYVSGSVVRANRIGSKVSVYGESLYFEYSQPTWSTATDLDSGESLTANTTYYCYLTPSGVVKVSSVAPTERKFDLLGGYHPAKPYRSVAEFAVDGGSNITSTSVLIAEHHQRVLPSEFVGTPAIKDSAVTTAKITTSAVSTDKIAAAAVTSPKIQTNVDLAGNLVTENGKALIVSNTNAAASLAVVRGGLSSGGSLNKGEGFSSVRDALGTYTVTYSTAFSDNPVIVVSVGSGGATAHVTTISTTAASFSVFNFAGSPFDAEITFISIGIRA